MKTIILQLGYFCLRCCFKPIFLFTHTILQAMYAYMKGAYLSMLSREESQPFTEDEVALFR